MRIARSTTLLSILALAALFLGAACGRAGAAGAERQPVPKPAQFACDHADEAIKAASFSERVNMAVAAIQQPCRPLPGSITGALRQGKWPDGAGVKIQERETLMIEALKGRFPEAETLAVSLLEQGSWPDGAEFTLQEGADVIRNLGGGLTPYRVHLLLDIWEQKPDDYVRWAVLDVLRNSTLDEARLPALDAVWNSKDALQKLGQDEIAVQPEKTADGVLARVIKNLPQGSMLQWALRLAGSHPGELSKAAKQARGL
jgi:uncharacterized protein YeaC (DUF1315 family)